MMIGTLLVGAVQPLGATGHNSGIAKLSVARPFRLGVNGFEGDGQADPRHGGPEKAVHHYAAEHYPYWRETIGERAVLRRPGAFGENLSTHGMTEDTVCIGDVYRLGSATVQVTQTRQPCWKLNTRFDQPDMALQVQRSGKTGWYYRVLEEGMAGPGDALELIERSYPQWTLASILKILYHRTGDRDALAQLAQLAALPARWRDLFVRRLATGAVEDWTERLTGSV